MAINVIALAFREMAKLTEVLLHEAEMAKEDVATVVRAYTEAIVNYMAGKASPVDFLLVRVLVPAVDPTLRAPCDE